jgi:hypothetical protein
MNLTPLLTRLEALEQRREQVTRAVERYERAVDAARAEIAAAIRGGESTGIGLHDFLYVTGRNPGTNSPWEGFLGALEADVLTHIGEPVLVVTSDMRQENDSDGSVLLCYEESLRLGILDGPLAFPSEGDELSLGTPAYVVSYSESATISRHDGPIILNRRDTRWERYGRPLGYSAPDFPAGYVAREFELWFGGDVLGWAVARGCGRLGRLVYMAKCLGGYDLTAIPAIAARLEHERHRILAELAAAAERKSGIQRHGEDAADTGTQLPDGTQDQAERIRMLRDQARELGLEDEVVAAAAS